MGLIALLLACETGSGRESTPVADSGDDDSGPAPDSGDSGDTGDSGDPPDTGDTGPVPVDADGDGHDNTTDCDDADARIHPGATDRCDGVDQDCDGDPVGDGMCGEVGTIADLDTLYWVGEEAGQWFSGGPLAQFDGEILMGGYLIDKVEGAFADAIFRGIPTGDDHRWSPGTLGLWRGRSGVSEVNALNPAGDFDGDGADDLWIWTGEWSPERGDYRLVLGPADRWPAEGIYGDEAGDGVWSETEADNDTLGSAGPGRDIDGDGRADVVHYATRGLTFIFGREDVEGDYPLTAEPWLDKDTMLSAPNAYIGPDLDGDGTLEVLLDSTGEETQFPYLDGASLRAASGQPVLSVVTTVPVAQDTVRVGGHIGDPTAAGDVDGDGLDDIVGYHATASGQEDWLTCPVWISAGALPTASTVEDAFIAEACWLGDLGWGGEADPYGGQGDIDGDGIIDPRFALFDRDLYDDHGWYAVGCVFGTSRLARAGVTDVSEISVCYNGLGSSIPDVDGDGRDDFIAYNMEWLDADTDNYGRTDILLGFDIPFDDPTKW